MNNHFNAAKAANPIAVLESLKLAVDNGLDVSSIRAVGYIEANTLHSDYSSGKFGCNTEHAPRSEKYLSELLDPSSEVSICENCCSRLMLNRMNLFKWAERMDLILPLAKPDLNFAEIFKALQALEGKRSSWTSAELPELTTWADQMIKKVRASSTFVKNLDGARKQYAMIVAESLIKKYDTDLAPNSSSLHKAWRESAVKELAATPGYALIYRPQHSFKLEGENAYIIGGMEILDRISLGVIYGPNVYGVWAQRRQQLGVQVAFSDEPLSDEVILTAVKLFSDRVYKTLADALKAAVKL